MKLPALEYRAPTTLEQAIALLAALGSDARVLAGGQSLLPMMRFRVVRPHVLVDLSRVAELRSLSLQDGTIGAMVTHDTLERQRGDLPVWRLVAAHAAQIAFAAVRNRGTLGGSLVQADPAGDWPLLFHALRAQVRISSLRGDKTVPLAAFVRGPLEVDLQVDELVTAIALPAASLGLEGWGRAKLMQRAGEYASSAAVAVRLAGGAWSCWAGALPGGPLRLAHTEAELARGACSRQALYEAARADLAEAVPDGAAPLHRHTVNALRAIASAQASNRSIHGN
ncbi:hypothetical protein N234_37000 [Ralstonia pickettii DTP0602]|nr:hypothetical protein N234_37000 [Ralstonia pickettii DTP0602]